MVTFTATITNLRWIWVDMSLCHMCGPSGIYLPDTFCYRSTVFSSAIYTASSIFTVLIVYFGYYMEALGQRRRFRAAWDPALTGKCTRDDEHHMISCAHKVLKEGESHTPISQERLMTCTYTGQDFHPRTSASRGLSVDLVDADRVASAANRSWLSRTIHVACCRPAPVVIIRFRSTVAPGTTTIE